MSDAGDDRRDPGGEGDAGDVLRGQVERDAYRHLFQNKRYVNLFLAMGTSSLGDWIGVFAILALTESILGPTRAAAFALSGVMIARVLPTLLLGPVAGVFVDRWDRKRTMIATDIGRGLMFAAIPFAQDVLSLFLATFFIETLSTLFIPAKDATVPNIVERRRLVHANQLSLLATYAPFPLGAAMFGALSALAIALFGDSAFFAERPSALPIWVNAGTFLLSAVFIARIALPAEHRRKVRTRGSNGETANAWEELKEGLRFIAHQPLVRALVVGVMAAAAAAGIVLAVGKLYATILNSGDSGFGFLGSAVGVGMAAGLVFSGWASQRIDKERLFAPGIGVAGGGLIVAALMPRLDIALIPAAVMGFGTGVGFVTGYTLLQERSADAVRGRTFAAFNTGVRLALFTSLIFGPAVVGIIGPERPEGGQNPLDSATDVGGGEVTGEVVATYAYQIGGVRISLILAGMIALVGAVWTGRAIHRVLSATDELHLAPDDEPFEARTGRGLFVVFEGGEGAGKSTQMRLLRAAVERAGYDAVITREPGGTEIGERIRALLLDRGSEGLSERAEALLYAAARAQHADEVIRPALDKGAVVLCDRYIDSSVAYQGVGRGLGEAQIKELNRWGTERLVPDLVVLLDVDVEAGFGRLGAEPDRLEAESLDFHRTVNRAFRRLADQEPGLYVVLDASRSVEDLHREIRSRVMARLEDAEGTRRTEPTRQLEPDGDIDPGSAAEEGSGDPGEEPR